jgi:hypothetical protein
VIVLQQPTANTAASIVKKQKKAEWLKLVAAVGIDPARHKFLEFPAQIIKSDSAPGGMSVSEFVKRRLDEDYRTACRFKYFHDRGMVWSPETSKCTTIFCNHI